MKNFFRWASAILAITLILGATFYFLRLRDDTRLVDGTPAATTLDESATTIIAPAPEPPVEDAVQPTPEPANTRAAVVIVPPDRQDTTPPVATPEPEATRDAPAISDSIPGPAPEITAAIAADISDTPPVTATLPAESATPGIAPADAPSIVASTLVTSATTSTATSAVISATSDVADNAAGDDPESGVADPTPTPEDIAWLAPAPFLQVPDSLAFGISTPEVRAEIVAEPAVTAITVVDLLPTPTPDAPLPQTIQVYRAPDPASAIPDVTMPRRGLEIVARDTTGAWYLLVDGFWIRAANIQNPPALLPLVVPTVTPTPTNTGEPTPTEIPLPATPAPPTPTPTPTSLDFPVCDCAPNTYACVAHDFPVRAQAQACFEYCFRTTGFDVHNLDAEGNGLACENLSP